MSEKRKYGVPDLERAIHGSTSHSRSPSQREIRRVLRLLGYGVGHGYRYEWTTKKEMERVAREVRAPR